MSKIDKNGMLVAGNVMQKRFPGIEHGRLSGVEAIVVHQTDAPTAQHTLNAYVSGGNGAHFLIAKDGTIYQTASLLMRCYHVGRRIKSKCLTVNKSNCDNKRMAKILAQGWTAQIKAIDAHERAKSYPDRYPVNSDSVGIEIVGDHSDKTDKFEVVTPAQNTSLQWLVGELYSHFSMTAADVYRHPEVSYKHKGEASTAVWK